jgi:branched-chain amino acid transport system substrate-binding protein
MIGKKLKMFGLTSFLTLALVTTACGNSTSNNTGNTSAPGSAQPSAGAAAGETIKIGAIWDVTGAGSSLGLPERNALRMLVEETNANGGINGRLIELIEADNQSNETKALTEAKRMINEEKVVAIIGGAQSTTSLAMVPAIEEAGVPYISNGSHPNIIEGRKWSFRTPPSDYLLVRKVLEDAKARGFKKIGVLRVNNDYGKQGETQFINNAPEFGIEITGTEQFNADDKDVKVQLTKLIDTKPDAIAVWAIPPGSAVAAKNFHELGQPGIQFYASSATATPRFIELAGEGAEGVIFPSYKYQVVDDLPKDDPQYEVIKNFRVKYEAKYNDTVYAVSNAADAWYLLEDAIRRAGDNITRETIRDNLETTKGVVGQIGVYNMSPDDHNGLDGSGLTMLVIKDGKFVLANK